MSQSANNEFCQVPLPLPLSHAIFSVLAALDPSSQALFLLEIVLVIYMFFPQLNYLHIYIQ